MEKKGNSRVTLINIIALLGFALLGFFTFMGEMFFSGGSTGISIAIAIGAVVITALLLSAAIYCKTVDNDFARWRKMEILCVILFWGFSIFPAKYVVHCFDIMSQKEQLKKTASEDVDKVKSMFAKYEENERNFIDNTRTGLENAIGNPSDESVTGYMEENSIKSDDDIDSWMMRQREILLGDRGRKGFAYTRYHQRADSVINNWHSEVAAWNVMSIITSAGDIEALCKQIAEDLSENSTNGKLPVIATDPATGDYTVTLANQTIEIYPPTLGFAKSFSEFRGFGENILFILIYMAIMLLIFLNYIMARRSAKTEITAAPGIDPNNRGTML